MALIFATKSYSQHTVTVKKGNMTFQIMGDSIKYKFKSKVAQYEDKFEDAANFLKKDF